ncbi:MAG TPA: outer membrane beta-barrel protein [Candidatus Acidoferrales bacterium]|nr:outer membrane beta-barrel protein [Candidatus Acidoferrales bacterium]
MRKIALIFGLFLAAPLATQAQRIDVFTGYSLLRVDENPSNISMNGWEGSVEYKFSDYLGVKADFSANYGTILGTKNMNIHGYYVGPELRLKKRISPFVHVLLGDTRLSIPGEIGNHFSVVLGGGADLRINDLLSIRLIQADIPTGNLVSTSVDGRISTGLVFHF